MALATCSEPEHEERARRPPAPLAPTYYEDVAPILATECVSCHRPDGIAPFALLSYEDARKSAAAIAVATTERTMPPFNLDNSGACNQYAEARWLDDEQIATLAAWAAAGAPAGDRRDAPEVAPPPRGLDRVDLSLRMAEPYVPASSKDDDYRCFVLDPGLAEDRFITAFHIHPGEPRMVHHLTLFALDSAEVEQAAAALDEEEAGPGYTCFGDTRVPSRWLAGSGPGGGAVHLPEGTGLPMGAGRKTILQVHYNLANGILSDQTAIDFELAPSVRTVARVARLADVHLDLPPGKPEVKETETLTLPEPVRLWGLWPHMHNLGAKLEVVASSSGAERCIARVNRYDFHWQGFAHYTEPIDLAAGDTMRITCTYDTMSRRARTTWGDGTADEMCIAFFYVTDPPRSR
jgi:hypothetical protein